MRCVIYPLLLAAVMGLAPAWAQTQAGPFADVPTNDPAYEAVQQLAAEGWFTGYFASTFNGKRALTRYEFAVAIQLLYIDVRRNRRSSLADGSQLLRAVSQVVSAHFPRSEPAPSTRLASLIDEFQAEVSILGGDPAAMLRQLKVPPVTEVIPVPPRPDHELPSVLSARKLARREWDAGQAVLYTTELEPPQHVDLLLAIPIHLSHAGIDVDLLTRARIDAHNDEVYRLVLERGLPPNSRLPWLSLIEHPDKATGDAQVRVRLSPQAIACHFGELTVTVRRPSTDVGRLSLHSRGWTHELKVPWSGSGTLELFSGPPESELLFLRVPGEPAPFTVIDLRCGEVLH